MSRPEGFWTNNGLVFAMFPEVNGDMDNERICSGWMYLSGHASFDYARELRLSRPATEGEYAALLSKIKDAGIVPIIAKRAPAGSSKRRLKAVTALWSKKYEAMATKAPPSEDERLERWNVAAKGAR